MTLVSCESLSRRKMIFTLSATVSAALLGGCAATVHTIKTGELNSKIKSIVIWNTGGLSEEFSTLLDRMDNTATALQQYLGQSKVASKILTSKRMDPDKQARLVQASSDVAADHVLSLTVIKASKRAASIAVEYFDYEAVLTEISSQKRLWRAQVSANFFSQSDAMANDLYARLKKDGLIT
jgi:hypothetical protein